MIGTVTAWNLQAAFAFITAPSQFSSGFELSGFPGTTAIRGIGILFLIWNIPYVFAAWNPVKNNHSLKETVFMQAIGLLGECGIYITLSQDHLLLQASILRFVIFDGMGLVMLIAAYYMVRMKNNSFLI